MTLTEILEAVAPPHVRSLPTYQPGKPVEELERELGISGAITLASNENPLGASPRALAAAAEALGRIAEYPDGGAFKLRRAIAERLGVGGDEIIFGAGCNEIIYMAVSALCRPGDEVLTHRHAFVSYKLAALARDARPVEAAVTGELGCDVEAILDAVTDRTRVVFVANPNNPTGAHLGAAQLDALIDNLPERILLVIDEAYYEYASTAPIDYGRSLARRDRRPMLLTLRTFSKIYGLAGLRVGYAIGRPELIALIERVRRPFNLNLVAQEAALAALGDDDHARASAELASEQIVAIRTRASELGLVAYPSAGNFVLVDVGRDAGEVYTAMLERGVIVRPMQAWGLPTCLRISVGTSEQTERAMETLTGAVS